MGSEMCIRDSSRGLFIQFYGRSNLRVPLAASRILLAGVLSLDRMTWPRRRILCGIYWSWSLLGLPPSRTLTRWWSMKPSDSQHMPQTLTMERIDEAIRLRTESPGFTPVEKVCTRALRSRSLRVRLKASRSLIDRKRCVQGRVYVGFSEMRSTNLRHWN